MWSREADEELPVSAERSAAIDRECPSCGAKPGERCDTPGGLTTHFSRLRKPASAAYVRERSVGTEPWRGWIEVDQGPVLVRVYAGERGEGHDEPPRYRSASLTYAEVAELRDVLNEVLADYDGPTAKTYNYQPRACDTCGELVETERERSSWFGSRRRVGLLRWRDSWFGHTRCRPAWVPRPW